MEVRILNKKQWAQAGVKAIGAAMYICIFAAFMLLLASVSVALNGPEGIDASLRMGYYDMDTGTLLMATWAVE